MQTPPTLNGHSSHRHFLSPMRRPSPRRTCLRCQPRRYGHPYFRGERPLPPPRLQRGEESAVNLEKALEGLGMGMGMFINLCILIGCDYLETIKGMGPKSALKLIREYGGLKGVVKRLRERAAEKKAEAEAKAESDDDNVEEDNEESREEDQKKKAGGGGMQIPEEWPWEEAKVFEHPDVLPAEEAELEWKNPDVDGLVQFLVTEKGFNEDRVRKGADKLQKFLNSKQQGRLDGFFTVKPKTSPKKGEDGKDDGAKGKGKGKVHTKGTKGTKRKIEDKKEASGR